MSTSFLRALRALLLVPLFLHTFAAEAADAGPARWALVDRRATAVAWAGVATAGAASLGVTAAILSGDGTVWATGLSLSLASTPMITGGAMRSRRALLELGAPVAGRRRAIASWTLYGLTWPLAVAATAQIARQIPHGTAGGVCFGITLMGLSMGCLVASWGTGIALIAADGRARYAPIPLGATRPPVRVAIAPRIDRHGAGVGLVATW